jgi:hypothetical protein
MTAPGDDDDERTNATGLTRFAYEYLNAAFAVVAAHSRQKVIDRPAPVPVLYLLGHSIELTFKAYLRQHGVTLRQLRKIGHDLCRGLEDCNALGLGGAYLPTNEQLAALQVLNDVYEAKELEYIRTGFTQWPRYELVEELAVGLFNAVAPLTGFPRSVNLPKG